MVHCLSASEQIAQEGKTNYECDRASNENEIDSIENISLEFPTMNMTHELRKNIYGIQYFSWRDFDPRKMYVANDRALELCATVGIGLFPSQSLYINNFICLSSITYWKCRRVVRHTSPFSVDRATCMCIADSALCESVRRVRSVSMSAPLLSCPFAPQSTQANANGKHGHEWPLLINMLFYLNSAVISWLISFLYIHTIIITQYFNTHQTRWTHTHARIQLNPIAAAAAGAAVAVVDNDTDGEYKTKMKLSLAQSCRASNVITVARWQRQMEQAKIPSSAVKSKKNGGSAKRTTRSTTK